MFSSSIYVTMFCFLYFDYRIICCSYCLLFRMLSHVLYSILPWVLHFSYFLFRSALILFPCVEDVSWTTSLPSRDKVCILSSLDLTLWDYTGSVVVVLSFNFEFFWECLFLVNLRAFLGLLDSTALLLWLLQTLKLIIRSIPFPTIYDSRWGGTHSFHC